MINLVLPVESIMSANKPGKLFLELNEKHQNGPDVDQKIKDRVQELAEEIDINDNPVILIGKMK